MRLNNNRFLFFSLISVFFLFSCDYLGLEKKESDKKSIVIASIGTEKLYKEELLKVLPRNISSQDSLVFVKSFINKWATNILLLEKAKNNISEKDNSSIQELVNNYKESLLINNYKEKLVKQKLDTIVNDTEIEAYYNNYNSNFKLNEDLVKIKYLHVSNDFNELDEAKTLFTSDNISDLDLLTQQQLSFIRYHFNDSIWLSVENILLKLPFKKEELLKKTKIIQKQDSLGVYLASVNDVLERNSVAPLEYIKPTVKQMILHQRKLELIREIEKIIVQDAVKNEIFKTY